MGLGVPRGFRQPILDASSGQEVNVSNIAGVCNEMIAYERRRESCAGRETESKVR